MIEKLLRKAISFLGVSEPTGDDQFIEYYNKLTGAGFSMTVAWCAIFVTVIARMVGIPTSIIPTFASCDVGANWFRNKKRYEKAKYYGGNYTPKRGDVIFYSSKHTQNDSTHVGYVVSVTGDTIKAIEGNKNDAVGYRTIKVSDKYILGYGRVADFIGGDDAASEPEQPKEFQCSVSDFQSYLNRQYPNTIKTNCGAWAISRCCLAAVPLIPAARKICPVCSSLTVPAPAILSWWNWPSVRWAMWAVIPIGAGTALTPVWNGVPALYHGAMVNPVERNHALLVVSLRVFRGSSLMDSGAHEDMKTSPPVMPFSSIGIWMVPQTMWELLSAPMAAVFIPWREIPAMPARSKVMT